MDAEKKHARRDDRRRYRDRRRFSLNTLAYAVGRPRRGRIRRDTNAGDQHVDFFPPGLLWLCVAILVVSALDAFLVLLHGGGALQEMPAPLAALLEAGAGTFVAVKLLATGLFLSLLVAVSSLNVFRVFQVRSLLGGIAFVYAMIVIPQLWLL